MDGAKRLIDLMDAPSIPRQPFCSLPWCGHTGKIDMHHVVPRSQGGHDGPQIPLCHGCHMNHHSVEHIEFIYDGAWYASLGSKGGWLVVYNEHADPIPFDDALPDATDFLDTLAVQRHADWLLSHELVRLSQAYGGESDEFRDFIIDACDLSPRSAGAWIRNRIAYGALQGEGVEYIGITRGVQIARLVATGHDLCGLMYDLRTMPREQFDSTYPSTGGQRLSIDPHAPIDLAL